tara:strand:- start:77 stop:274 length:198 start_codon:yes stop_codon:yes gene_type:complete
MVDGLLVFERREDGVVARLPSDQTLRERPVPKQRAAEHRIHDEVDEQPLDDTATSAAKSRQVIIT